MENLTRGGGAWVSDPIREAAKHGLAAYIEALTKALSEALPHAPFRIIGRHAEQNVRAQPGRGPLERRTQFEIDSIQDAESVLGAADDADRACPARRNAA